MLEISKNVYFIIPNLVPKFQMSNCYKEYLKANLNFPKIQLPNPAQGWNNKLKQNQEIFFSKFRFPTTDLNFF